MDLDDYLKQEGVFNNQNYINDIVGTLDTILAKQFEDLSNKRANANIQKNISAFYDFIVEIDKYNIFLSGYYLSIKQTIPFMQKNISGEYVLDVGCGNGLKTIFYALNNPDKKFIGVDISYKSLKDAHLRKQKYGLKNIHFALEDMTNLQFAKKFDTIIADKVLHETQQFNLCYDDYEPQFTQHLVTLKNQLADNGKILVTLCPCNADSFLGYFEHFVNCAKLNVEELHFVNYVVDNHGGVDVVYKLKKSIA